LLPIKRTGTNSRKKCSDFVEPTLDATLNRDAVMYQAKVEGRLGAHIFSRFGRLPALVERCRDLLETKRDQNAENDDADLPNELAPTVQRFGKMKVDEAPPRLRQRNRRANGCNGSKADRSGRTANGQHWT